MFGIIFLVVSVGIIAQSQIIAERYFKSLFSSSLSSKLLHQALLTSEDDEDDEENADGSGTGHVPLFHAVDMENKPLFPKGQTKGKTQGKSQGRSQGRSQSNESVASSFSSTSSSSSNAEKINMAGDVSYFAGIFYAVLVGLFGGSILVPMHYVDTTAQVIFDTYIHACIHTFIHTHKYKQICRGWYSFRHSG